MKKPKIKKNGTIVISEKTIEFEETELSKIHLERVINKIKREAG